MGQVKARTKFRILFAAGLFLTILLTSCEAVTGFFSTSWGSKFQRDLARLLPPISAQNALELAEDTAGDPEKAKIVAKKITEALLKTTDPGERKALLKAGLVAANNASRLITVMMGNIDTFSDPQVSLGTILEKIQDAGDVPGNAALISGILDAGGVDITNSDALAGISQDNLVLAAVTLLLADVQKDNILDQEAYLEDFAEKQAQGGSGLTKKQDQALVLASVASNQTGALKEVLHILKFN
ncbi:MAG: hypothetical protein LBL19_07915 [Spirochaetaceae bacterium]|jgi:hypothetical protein|nr:hypothetical protein [Spirochaetaceae bacterium]